jgi:xanthine dehydrogenase molybdenum-binding subunit
MTRALDSAAPPACRPIKLTVNDHPAEALIDGQTSLLDVLRDQLGLTSPKNGCAPQAQCGCCAVLVDGRVMLSCALKADKVCGKEVTTCEGLPDELRRQVAECFVRAGGVQCGFCIPASPCGRSPFWTRTPSRRASRSPSP